MKLFRFFDFWKVSSYVVSNWRVLRVRNDAKHFFLAHESFVRRAEKWFCLPRGQNDHVTTLWRRNDDSVLREERWKILRGRRREARSESEKKGGRYCVAGGPNMTSCKNKQFTKNVSLQNFPSEPDRRNKWTKFVRRHRPGWNPSKQSHLCSVHFEESCFERMRVCKMTGQTRLPLVA